MAASDMFMISFLVGFIVTNGRVRALVARLGRLRR
jgi:hypothetical protein